MKFTILLIALCLTSTLAESRTKRSTSAKHEFMREHPCPSFRPHKKYSCPGFVIDHIKALACGGADAPSNMQWQTVIKGKAKDKWERKGCEK